MKYELTSETRELKGKILHRIRALKDFADVKKGDLGGFIESENNLSQDGTSWVYDNSAVLGNAKVSGGAVVCGNSILEDFLISGITVLYADSYVCEERK